MARILALDYGIRRTGVAVTDPFQLIASGLTTVPTEDLWTFLDTYLKEEDVERIVVGEPKQMDNTPSEVEGAIGKFLLEFSKRYPKMPVSREDERFTSKMALRAMIDGGMKKKKRRQKGALDEISATLILQSFLSRKTL
ncbi:Holliday junction resolvase RuvX [Robiginitalea aurantiaca]|uniref:Putative pre-16S rRNA nuclease n=1 Tax=Robiginitalea aurantiaca TaxID=3056915 RepID=A0ABT7WD97_9FLAO|nr:Holliday junction resolvase RuvX [Robiginitalea aurantiaca]MDM9630789.1 Holliday junction resolvase RuvX [Robiginitalea aurantiaca]